MSTLVHGRDALLLELAELLWIERTLVFELLPPTVEVARDAELREALDAHLDATRRHVTRVESAFGAIGAEAASARSAALTGLWEQHDSQSVTEPTLRDLLSARSALRTEHLELAVYDSVAGLARELGFDEAVDLLAQNREDEEEALERLSRIARRLRAELPR